MNAVFYLGLLIEAAAFGLLIGSPIFLVWGLLGKGGPTRQRRLRIALSCCLLFVAMFVTGAWLIFFVQMPAIVRSDHAEFTAPYTLLGYILTVIGPGLLFASVGLLMRKTFRTADSQRHDVTTSAACFLLFLVSSLATYHLVYSVQMPALARYSMIESRPYLTRVGEPAPDVSFALPDGSELRISDLRGKVVVLNFFATWCGPCLAELPHLQETWDEFAGNDEFTMLIAGREESQESVAAFQSKNGFTFPFAIDSDRTAYNKFADEGIPRTYLISRDGKILFQTLGFGENNEVYQREVETLRELIEQELDRVP